MSAASDMADMKAQIEALSDKVDTLTHALLEPPAEGGPSFLTEAKAALAIVRHGGWAFRSGTRLVLTIGAVSAAVMAAKLGLWDLMGWND